jgi:hypothetical protein
MRWTYGFYWKKRKDIINHIKDNYTFTNEVNSLKVIDHTSNGKWWLLENTKNDGTVRRHILQTLIAYDKKDKCYGYKDSGLESGPSDLSGLPKKWLKDPLVGWGNNEHYPYYEETNEKLKSSKFVEPHEGEEIMTGNGKVITFQYAMNRKGLKFRYVFSDGFLWDKKGIERGRKNLQYANMLNAQKEVL